MRIQKVNADQKVKYITALKRLRDYSIVLIEEAEKENFKDQVLEFSIDPIRKNQLYFGRILYNYNNILSEIKKIDEETSIYTD